MKKILFPLVAVAILVMIPVMLETGGHSESVTLELSIADPVLVSIDEALYTKLPLAEHVVDFPLTTEESATNLEKLIADNPSEYRYRQALAKVYITLMNEEAAVTQMQKAAELHPDNEAGLTLLADFYHQRMMLGEEIATLLKLADMQAAKPKIATLRKILKLKNDFLIDSIDPVSVYRKMNAAAPEDAKIILELIDSLIDEKRLPEALTEIDNTIRKFPDLQTLFLIKKAEIFRQQNRLDDALEIYDRDMSPITDQNLFAQFTNLLQRMDRYKKFVRSLQRKSRLRQMTERDFQHYFLLLHSQRKYNEAAKILNNWVDYRNADGLSSEDLKMFEQAFTMCGKYYDAWKACYARHIKSGNATGRADALAGLIKYTRKLGSQDLHGSNNPLAAVAGVDRFDRGPGVAGGIASLLYNDQDLEWRIEDLNKASGNFQRDRLFLNLSDYFLEKYPESEFKGEIYAGIVGMYNGYSRPDKALSIADLFLKDNEDSGHYFSVAEEALVSLAQLKNKARIEAMLTTLVAKATAAEDKELKEKYFNQLMQFYVSEKRLKDAVAFYWQEINADPKNEELYQKFLRFLSTHRIFNEEAKVYRQAIDTFKTMDYYDKLARWYIRQKRKTDFQDLAREVSEIFSDSELYGFFKDHLRHTSSAQAADTVFYRTMYEYANQRFPRNLKFVENLLTFYSSFRLWDEYEALAFKYFYADESIRRNLLRLLSRYDKLPTQVAAVRNETDLNAAEKLFLAESASWNSLFEEALPVLEDLAEQYPNQTNILAGLAKLRRSLGDDNAAEEIYIKLAELHPHEKEYLTLAGEIAIENSRTEKAASLWRKIYQIKPADQDLYLEVASIFWDYYQFDEAADVLLLARTRLKQPALFGSKLAAVYESAKNYNGAIVEYIHTAALKFDDYWLGEEALDRLVYLANKRGYANKINTEFARLTEESGNLDYLKAHDKYLKMQKQTQARTALLNSAFASFTDLTSQNWFAEKARLLHLQEMEEQALKNIIAIEGESVENLLRLANLFERLERVDKAAAIHQRRIASMRTIEPEGIDDYLGTLKDAANFYWRNELYSQAYQQWETAAVAADGYKRKNLYLELANRYLVKKQYDQASRVLTILLNENPTAVDVFNSLARVYSDQEDYRGLTDLYQRGIEAVRKDDSFNRIQRLDRIAGLRVGLINNLVKLGDFTAAVDQYIEIINRNFDNTTYLENAFTLASQHELAERLIDYYKRTSEQSHKDHRWNFVLARLYELSNQHELAAIQWNNAVRNEPQNKTVRLYYSRTLQRLGKFDDAIEQLREIYRLDERNTRWLSNIAVAQARAGNLPAAEETLKELLATNSRSYNNYFLTARYFKQWGDYDRSWNYIKQGLDILKNDLFYERLKSANLELMIEVGIAKGLTYDVYSELLTLNNLFRTEANKSGSGRNWEARQGQQLTYDAFSGSFARHLNSLRDEKGAQAVEDSLRSYLTKNSSNKGTVNWVLAMARACNMTKLTGEALAARILINANRFRNYDYDSIFSDTLEFYQNRADYAEAANALERELTRISMGDYRLYLNKLLVDIYQMLGEEQKEMTALSRIWGILSKRSRSAFAHEDEYVSRYLALLLANDRMSELKLVISRPGNFAGEVINLLLANNRTDLAAETIDAITSRYSPKWRDSKKLIISYAYNRPLSELGAYGPPADLMQYHPIDVRISKSADRMRQLAGDEWYHFLPHYASWLMLNSQPELAVKFMRGLPELSARSAATYRTAASWFIDNRLWDEADNMLMLAEQLSANDPQNLILAGTMKLKQGDSAGALATWQKIADDSSDFGRQRLYFETLNANGFKQQAMDSALELIKTHLALEMDWRGREYTTEISGLLLEEGKSEMLAQILIEKSRTAEEPLALLAEFLNEWSLSTAAKMNIYSQLVAVSEVTTKSQTEEDYYQPVYKTWLEEAISFAIDNRLAGPGIEWIQLYEEEEYAKSPSWRIGSRDKLYREKARFYFTLGRKEEGLAALDVSLEDSSYYSADSHQAVKSILIKSGYETEAEEMMLDFYRSAIGKGYTYGSYYLGLAEILLTRHIVSRNADELGEANIAINRMVNAFPNNIEGLTNAANLLNRFDLNSEEIYYRKQLMAIDPHNDANILALARALAESEDADGARKLMSQLFVATGSKQTILYSAVDDFVALIPTEECTTVAAGFAKTADLSQVHRILVSELLDRAGDEAGAKAQLDSAGTIFTQPDLILYHQAQQAFADNRLDDGITLLKKSVSQVPTKERWYLLLTKLYGAKRYADLLLAFDSMNYTGITAGSDSDLLKRTGVGADDRIELFNMLIDAALAMNKFELAEQYEYSRSSLATEVDLTRPSRKDEIEEAKKLIKAPLPKIKIEEAIAN